MLFMIAWFILDLIGIFILIAVICIAPALFKLLCVLLAFGAFIALVTIAPDVTAAAAKNGFFDALILFLIPFSAAPLLHFLWRLWDYSKPDFSSPYASFITCYKCFSKRSNARAKV